MCLHCTYSNLEQLRWELLLQESELTETKLSSEVLETVKERVQQNGGKPILPLIKLERPKEMSDIEYDEALQIFKDGMLQSRRATIAAIETVTNMLENEVFQPETTINVNAGAFLGELDESNGEG